jgi:hypothetical protein
MFCVSCGKEIPPQAPCPYCDSTAPPALGSSPAQQVLSTVRKKKNAVLLSIIVFLVGMLGFYLLTRLAIITSSSKPFEPTSTSDTNLTH